MAAEGGDVERRGPEQGPAEGSNDMDGPSTADAAAGPAFDLPFARLRPPFTFYQDALMLTLLGAALGAFGYAYLQSITQSSDAWLRADGRAAYPQPSTLGWGSGRPWYVGLCAGTGLAVGLTKVVLRLDRAPSFITELQALPSDAEHGWMALKVGVCCLMSLLGGMPMGPEAGLGALSGALGAFAARRLRPRMRQGAEARTRLHVLTCMCACFAALMPNAMTSLLLVLELGRPRALADEFTDMGLVVTLALASTASFMLYYAIAGYPYLRPLVTAASLQSFREYHQFGVVEALLFGVVGAALAAAYILIAGLCKAVFGAARHRLDARLGRPARMVILATLGGAATGLLGWALPLTLTDGAATLTPVLMQGGAIGSGVLAASCFSKMLAYHVCAECGFHGGLFLPMLSMGAMLGSVFINVTGVNPWVARSSSFIALGAAICPAPFALTILSSSVLLVGAMGLVPVFATATSAYLLCLGVGWPQALVARRMAREPKA